MQLHPSRLMRQGTTLPLAAFVALVFGLATDPLRAQAADTITISTPPACSACRITLARVATLGGPNDPVSPAEWIHSVSRDSRGLYYLAPTANFAMIAVYDAQGKYLKTLGRPGQGPGEYDFIVDAKVRGDSLFVLDQGAQRVTILRPDHDVAQIVRVQGAFLSLDLMADGTLLVRGTRGNPATSVDPIFRFNREGVLLNRFAGDGTGVRRDRVLASDRHLGTMRDATQVLVARLDKYQLEVWNPDGTAIKTVRRLVPWYEPWTDYTIGPFDMVKPQPMTRAVWQDSAGVVWTMNQVPVEGWKAKRVAVPGRKEPFLPASVTDLYVDTVLEAFDLTTGRVIASQRFPEYLQDYISDGLVYSLRTVDDDVRVDVWRVTLVGYK